MPAETGVPRVVLVESDPALRAALARALASSGFEVVAEDRVDPAADAAFGPGSPLHVVDLDAAGASAWLGLPAARAISVFLATDAEIADRVERRHGATVDVLVKPFPVERLEAKLIGRQRLRAGASRVPLDPILQTRDARLARVLAQADRLALIDGPVCIVGELGTGRRALARSIHAASPRSGEPCATLEATDLLEQAGDTLERVLEQRVALTGSGTLIVVEPAEWKVRGQVALQSLLREAGDGSGPRCITLARSPLEAAMRDGRIGAELAYRLSGPVLALPPLRERVVDQLDYCTALARRLAQTLALPTPRIDRAFVEALARAGFPGNRLGVENQLRRSLIGAGEGGVGAAASGASMGTAGPGVSGPGLSDPGNARSGHPATSSARVRSGDDGEAVLDLRALEREAIVRALARMQGNRTHASRALGISVRTLRNKIREYGLR